MRPPWIPRWRSGESSNTLVVDADGNEDGTEGWYLQVSWLGWTVSVEFGSVARSETWLERYRAKEKRAP